MTFPYGENGFQDLSDFMSFHPVPEPPVEERPADPSGEAFNDSQKYATRTPFGGRGSMTLVDRRVCKFPCDIPGHTHSEPVFEPQADLDEAKVGWTVQHIPPPRDAISKHCVLCWESCEDLVEHDCLVMALVNG